MKTQNTAYINPSSIFTDSNQADAQHGNSCTVLQKTKYIAQLCFEILTTIICFPLRYVGSKTWSIPGALLRTPLILFKRIIYRSNTPLIQELFPTHYRFSFEKKLSPEELKPYYPHVAATAFVHQSKDQFIPFGWKKLSPLTLGVNAANMEVTDSFILSSLSACKASMIEKGNTIIISFGSIEANEGSSSNEKIKSKKSVNILGSLLGFTPQTLEDADILVRELLRHPYFKNKNISLTGNSYGATIAAYAGLNNKIPAVCFNAFALGVGPQWNIGTTRLAQADQYITHISAEGDFTTDLSIYKPVDLLLNAIGWRTPGNFGRRFKIPSAYKGRCATHGFILGSVMAHLGHNIRTLPGDLINP